MCRIYVYTSLCVWLQFSTMLFAVLSVLFVIYPLKDATVLGNTSQSYDTPLTGNEPPLSAAASTAGPSWYTGAPLGKTIFGVLVHL